MPTLLSIQNILRRVDKKVIFVNQLILVKEYQNNKEKTINIIGVSFNQKKFELKY